MEMFTWPHKVPSDFKRDTVLRVDLRLRLRLRLKFPSSISSPQSLAVSVCCDGTSFELCAGGWGDDANGGAGRVQTGDSECFILFSGDAANSCEPGRLSFLATLVVCDRKCSIEKQRWEVVAGVRGDKWPTRCHPRVTRRPKLCSNLKFTPGDAFGLL